MRRIATIFLVLFWIIWMLGSAVERGGKASGVLENSSTAAASSPAKPKSTDLKHGVSEEGMKVPGAEDQKKGPAEIMASFWTAVLSIMVSFVLCVLFVVFCVQGVKDLWRETVRIDPIQVPKDLGEKGYTPQGIAQRLVVGIRKMQREARIQAGLEQDLVPSADEIDFTVPSAGISYRGMLRFLRQVLKRPEKLVQGELVRETGPNETIRAVLRTPEGRTTSFDLTVSTEKDLFALLEKVAMEIASLVDPHLFATYCFRMDEQRDRSFQKTFEAVKACFDRTRPEEHHKAYVIWGNALVLQRKFDEAEEKYRAAVELAPNFAPAYNSLGILQRSKRRFDEAADFFKQAIQLDRRYVYALGNLGNVCNDRRMYRAAKCYFKRAIQFDRSYPSVWHGLGIALWKLGFYADAQKKFARAIDLDPKFGWSYIGWARLLCQQRKYQAAIEKVRIAAEQTTIGAQAYALWGDILVDETNFDEAAKMYGRSIEADSNIADGLAGLGRLRARQKRYDEAISACEQANKVDPYHTAALFNWAQALRFSESDDNGAIQKYKKLLALDPYQVSAYVGLGEVLRRKGRRGRSQQKRREEKFREAISLFKRAIEFDPLDSWAWKSWGGTLMEMGCSRAAIQKFRKAVSANPWDSGALTDWGRALFQIGDQEGAKEKSLRAIDLDPEFGWSYLNLARLLRKQREYQAAIDKIRIAEVRLRFILETNVWAQIYTLWGDILVDAGKFDRSVPDERELDEAARMYRLADKADSKNVDGLARLARLRARQRRYDEAIAACEQANKIDPYHTEALFHWADALRFSGRYDAAIKKYKEVLALDPRASAAYVGMGITLRCKSKLNTKEAISLFEQATKMNPLGSWAWRSWAETLSDTERYKAAMRKFRKAIAVDAEEPQNYIGCAKVLEKLGRNDESIINLKQALRLKPGHADAERLLAEYRRGSAKQEG